jgi:hypothetical protein
MSDASILAGGSFFFELYPNPGTKAKGNTADRAKPNENAARRDP